MNGLQRLLDAVLAAAFPGFSLPPSVDMMARSLISCSIFLLLERKHEGVEPITDRDMPTLVSSEKRKNGNKFDLFSLRYIQNHKK